ncbi:hypothetical protein BDW02DRAFT_593697 [Decorospora gaudefroyi]|uniref:Uncharacterized protein n=1 Tax=Decorospora gaudefroyi TaxID=184978 RepID=A0A6A5KT35_9PLEO|nr:hypothetical protein BDW02DRAFT_593697 [Decorospora gaudefroyi]
MQRHHHAAQMKLLQATFSTLEHLPKTSSTIDTAHKHLRNEMQSINQHSKQMKQLQMSLSSLEHLPKTLNNIHINHKHLYTEMINIVKGLRNMDESIAHLHRHQHQDFDTTKASQVQDLTEFLKAIGGMEKKLADTKHQPTTLNSANPPTLSSEGTQTEDVTLAHSNITALDTEPRQQRAQTLTSGVILAQATLPISPGPDPELTYAREQVSELQRQRQEDFKMLHEFKKTAEQRFKELKASVHKSLLNELKAAQLKWQDAHMQEITQVEARHVKELGVVKDELVKAKELLKQKESTIATLRNEVSSTKQVYKQAEASITSIGQDAKTLTTSLKETEAQLRDSQRHEENTKKELLRKNQELKRIMNAQAEGQKSAEEKDATVKKLQALVDAQEKNRDSSAKETDATIEQLRAELAYAQEIATSTDEDNRIWAEFLREQLTETELKYKELYGNAYGNEYGPGLVNELGELRISNMVLQDKERGLQRQLDEYRAQKNGDEKPFGESSHIAQRGEFMQSKSKESPVPQSSQLSETSPPVLRTISEVSNTTSNTVKKPEWAADSDDDDDFPEAEFEEFKKRTAAIKVPPRTAEPTIPVNVTVDSAAQQHKAGKTDNNLSGNPMKRGVPTTGTTEGPPPTTAPIMVKKRCNKCGQDVQLEQFTDSKDQKNLRWGLHYKNGCIKPEKANPYGATTTARTPNPSDLLECDPLPAPPKADVEPKKCIHCSEWFACQSLDEDRNKQSPWYNTRQHWFRHVKGECQTTYITCRDCKKVMNKDHFYSVHRPGCTKSGGKKASWGGSNRMGGAESITSAGGATVSEKQVDKPPAVSTKTQVDPAMGMGGSKYAQVTTSTPSPAQPPVTG